MRMRKTLKNNEFTLPLSKTYKFEPIAGSGNIFYIDELFYVIVYFHFYYYHTVHEEIFQFQQSFTFKIKQCFTLLGSLALLQLSSRAKSFIFSI